MRNRSAEPGWPLVLLLLLLTAVGTVALVMGVTADASALFMASVFLALFLARRVRRCPACGSAGIPRRPTRGVFECDSCGERFRRVRQGSAVWLDVESPRRETEAGAPFARLRRGRLEHIPHAPDGRWAWVSAFLPRLRELRRQLRPLAGRPVRVLNLIKPPPVELDWAEPWNSVEPQASPPAPPNLWRTIAAQVALVAVSCAAVVTMVPSLSRLYALDSVYYVIVLFAIATCAVVAPVLGRLLKLTPTATLALLTSDLVLKALHLAAIGRFPDLYVLATIAAAFPTTPLLLCPLFRHWRVVEESAGDFTTGRLLRNKQARALKEPVLAGQRKR